MAAGMEALHGSGCHKAVPGRWPDSMMERAGVQVRYQPWPFYADLTHTGTHCADHPASSLVL